MKNIYISIPLQKITPTVYRNDDYKELEFSGAVVYPLNGYLAKVLKTGEKVKVIRIVTNKLDADNSQVIENLKIQQMELDEINKNIGAIIEYVDIVQDYIESKSTHSSRFMKIINTFEQNCSIYVDITYGPKTLVPMMFSALHFAEKFFNADIESVVYGKVEFDKNKQHIPGTSIINDEISLYLLNNLTSAIKAKNGEDAINIMKEFFEL